MCFSNLNVSLNKIVGPNREL